MRKIDYGLPALLALVAALGIVGAHATVDVSLELSKVLGGFGIGAGALAAVAWVLWMDQGEEE